MSNAVALRPVASEIERVLIEGDLERLTPEQRITYYKAVCDSVGLNPLTQPLSYIRLDGKLKLYALKACTDQLRAIHNVSVTSMDTRHIDGGVYSVTVQVRNKDGRTDMAVGAVDIAGLKGGALANALMKAETKAKRRATLSICGLGMLDETEVETVPAYQPPPQRAAPPPPKVNAAGQTMIELPEPPRKPAAPGPRPPVMIDDPARVEVTRRVRGMLLEAPPVGLGWHQSHASNWLTKYFGVKRPIDLPLARAKDAELLLLARLNDGEDYKRKLEMFYAEKRVLTAEVTE